MALCQQFARLNREQIAKKLLERAGLQPGEAFHTIHNYIDVDEMILRKGAIAAHKGEKVLIPINMRDGSILAIGKGNAEWNYSAPHGAGRIMSRTQAIKELSLKEYQQEMAGIYTTSVNEGTIDEAPMAYKSLDDILDVIGDTVDVIDVMKPVYNFKAQRGEGISKASGSKVTYMEKLGCMKRIDDLRSIWPHEEQDFSKWLAQKENLEQLSDAIEIDLELEKTESPVGSFSVDIYARESGSSRGIIIENQLEDTDHDHLGKIIMYAAGKDAEIIVWIVKRARDEHEQAIGWLNQHTDENIGFFLIEIENLPKKG